MSQQEADTSLMLEFALQAFQAQNFQLASDIYGRQLQEQRAGGVDWALLLRRAECLAYSGNLQGACDLYQRAAVHRKVGADQLKTLISCLADGIRTREGLPHAQGESKWGILSCKGCRDFLWEPVTLVCGHTYCKKCLEDYKGKDQCELCRVTLDQGDAGHQFKVNVVLSNILCKWFPKEVQARKLRQEGNALFKEGKLQEALGKYNQAIDIVSCDHLLYSNRSMIHFSLKAYECALQDAETACRLQPCWVKSHLMKAKALTSLGKTDYALREFLFCIALDTDNKTAKLEAQKLLLTLLNPENCQEGLPDLLQVIPHPFRVKGNVDPLSLAMPCSNLQRLNKVNLEKEILPMVSEHKVSSDCNTGKESFRSPGNNSIWQVSVAETTIPSKCISLKRKLSSDETEKSKLTVVPSKIQRRADVPVTDKADNVISVSPYVDSSDLDCSLCMRLMYEPVTTPCGHTYCLKCLERCLDHNPKCPLCKEDLCEYLAKRTFCKTEMMEELIGNYFPEELNERKCVYEEEIAELSNLNHNVPIFVCTMAYPTVPCPLHIFEPCYRLMIRRCMETGTKQFGMCIGDTVKGFADYGCMLEIRNVEFFADGRSVVDSIGRRRFKVIQHSQRDGYNTADIEYIEDEKVQGEDYKELIRLHDAVYDQAYNWFNSLKPQLRSRILSHFGPMPDKDSDLQINPNGPAWCWWILAVLPLESRAQLPFLAMTSLKDRLTSIKRVLLFMRRSRPR
ncbi:LON peptidase N-terminal domain and RING finger 3 isoform X1 [Pelobates cultripes]|uniref:LON peptidase N-terminal domain and RING finger 3 isoform X1 n=1 Tax=Pelobates cultripes TaxID=61616 RepID=A0AAD1SYR0_PELCU|nr:LON peptidase N-terminal domain and RING finger 3 isoform X1 [Pelobates cultripes]